MLQLDELNKKTLKLLEQEEKGKDLNPFYVSKKQVLKLLHEKSLYPKEFFQRVKILAQRFNLSKIEQDILMLLLAPLINQSYQTVYAYLQDDLQQKELTLNLASLLLDKSLFELYPLIQEDAMLRSFQIVELKMPMYQLILSESIRHFIFSSPTLDTELLGFCKLLSPKKILFDKQLEPTIKTIQSALANQQRFILHLQSLDRHQKEHTALYIAHALKYQLIHIDLSYVFEYSNNFKHALQSLFREAVLMDALLYFENYDSFAQHPHFKSYERTLIQQLDNFSGLSFIASQQKIPALPRFSKLLWYQIPLPSPSIQTCSDYWQMKLEAINIQLSSLECDKLAQFFNFNFEEINSIIKQLQTKLLFEKTFNLSLLYELSKQNIQHELNNLAQILKTEHRLEDIVLEEEYHELLLELTRHQAHQLQVFETWGFDKHYQSRGISALFTGASGTGKTMAASIVANHLGLDLYRIELSKMVSKYIGETEKNLSQIFDRAEGSGVVLFFDEADALFGKRSETQSSHDRYANIEVSYLLQKIEEYNGLVILASNFRQNIDEAFLRRMRFIINFPFPNSVSREKIWKKVFPENTPIENNINFSLLAKTFELSGANIRNIALFSAFYASEAHVAISIEHILKSLKIELKKLGKSIKESDFTLFNIQ